MRFKAALLGAVLLVLWRGPIARAGGADMAWGAVFPTPTLPAKPVRDLRLAATPHGGLLLATIQDDREAASWRGAFTARVVRLHQWQAGTWRPLGGVLNYDQPRPVSNLDLSVDAQGTPILVWNENFGDNDVIVFRAWEQGGWTDWRTRYLGVSAPSAARTRALGAQNGEPVLIHGEYRRSASGTQQTWLSLRRWDEAVRTWSRPAPLNTLGRFSRSPALGLDEAGRATVAYLEGEVLDTRLLVKREAGAGWAPLGGALNRMGPAYLASPRLELDRQGRPVVAWLEDRSGLDTLYVSRWTGTRWEALGGALSPRMAAEPALVLDARDGPVVAWVEERAGRGQIWLGRWVGGRWRVSGPLNADRGRDARVPRLVRLSTGQVVVAWREDVGGVYRVVLRGM